MYRILVQVASMSLKLVGLMNQRKLKNRAYVQRIKFNQNKQIILSIHTKTANENLQQQEKKMKEQW